MKRKIAFILGIRPDVIRASLILEALQKEEEIDLSFIWSGQHYSDNLKDIFFRELNVCAPKIELGARGETDAELVGNIIAKLYTVLEEIKPDCAVFLGDTNTVMGCIAAAQLNIPVVHIEGCMRSYDWRMPEEKYRTVSDHLSDVIYAYLPRYKEQGTAEGLNQKNIIVTGNPIVDVLNRHYYEKIDEFRLLATDQFFASRGIEKNNYYLLTAHRRENVEDRESLKNILLLLEEANKKVFFPASYRTQKSLKKFNLTLPKNLILVDPVGYKEFLTLLVNSAGVLTDSGTVVEEACILGMPSVQMRRSTERPEVYEVGASLKFDPSVGGCSDFGWFFKRLESLREKKWNNPFGDGKASQRIVNDLVRRARENDFNNHKPSDYCVDVSRAYSS